MYSMKTSSKERSIAETIEPLKGKNLDELRNIRKEMGVKLHQLLLSMNPRPKLILKNVVAAGSDADGLASNDGSSKYLAGGLVSYSGAISEALPLPTYTVDSGPIDSLGSDMFNFYRDSANIDDLTLLAGAHGDVSGEHAGEIIVYASDHSRTLSEKLQLQAAEKPGTPEHRQALQELSTIASFDALLRLLHANETRSKVSETLDSTTLEREPLLEEADKVFAYNKDVWRKLSPSLHHFLEEGRISIGESFTSGILAQIITSVEGASNVLDYSLNWYDPRLKQMVGVPPRNTEEDLIAEPETIALAAAGLLEKAPESTQIALGTTGWANYWVEGEPDYFSIGVAEKTESKPRVSTAYVKMTGSQDTAAPDKGRRQLTRHLGVTTALYMLVNALVSNHPGETELQEIRSDLMRMIEQYAEIEVEENIELSTEE